MAAINKALENGRASTIKKLFGRETSVSTEINAPPSVIWSLLTNAGRFPEWTSTVISIEGTIAPGETILLKSKLDPKRTFKLKVKEFERESKLIWGDAMGKREYTLTKNGGGSVLFTMQERIGGPLFPLFAKMIPPFDESFEEFAADLKKEAESIQKRN